MSRSVGARMLRHALCERKLTLEKAAEEFDIDPWQLSRWIHGRRVPSLASAIRLEQLFGIPIPSWYEIPLPE